MAIRETLTPVEAPAAGISLTRASWLALVLLSCGHFAVDLYSSALGALQPLLVERFGLTLARAGLLSGVLVFSASVAQPLYGYLSDRFHSRAFMVLAPAVAALFISALGLAPTYRWLLLLVLLGGAGVASFHPQASAWVVAEAGQRPGQTMGFFISAGALGYALGPTYFSFLVSRWGLERMHWAAIPGLAVTALLIWKPPRAALAARPHRGFQWRPLAAVWKPLVILYAAVFLRSILQIAFGQFLPLYLHRGRGFSIPAAGYALSAFLAAGAVGGVLGGRLADRFGGRSVILFSMLASPPFFALFFITSGWLSLACLVLGGFILLFTIPVNVVMAQQLAPAQAGTVSALMMGFAWGMAGMVFIPLIGFAADVYSLHTALAALTVFPLIGFCLAWKLPR
ncbi:MAG: MFS transporter [Bryobacteraceae bacterium]